MTEIKPTVTRRKWGNIRHPHTISYSHPTPTGLPSPPSCLSKSCQSSALTKHGEEPTGKPDEQGESHAAGVFQDSFGRNEDATANHAADEQRESPQQSDLLPQEDGLFFLVFSHGFLLITGEGATSRSYSLLKAHL